MWTNGWRRRHAARPGRPPSGPRDRRAGAARPPDSAGQAWRAAAHDRHARSGRRPALPVAHRLPAGAVAARPPAERHGVRVRRGLAQAGVANGRFCSIWSCACAKRRGREPPPSAAILDARRHPRHAKRQRRARGDSQPRPALGGSRSSRRAQGSEGVCRVAEALGGGACLGLAAPFEQARRALPCQRHPLPQPALPDIPLRRLATV